MTASSPGTLLSLGHGYSAQALARRLLPRGWRILGTTRSPEKAEALRETGVEPLLWEHGPVADALNQASHLLISAGPGSEGDPALALLAPEIAARAEALEWAGYLSTTAVYGDRLGGWVDEESDLSPTSSRGEARVKAETAWSAIAPLPLHIFRLAGIYGPGRGPFEKVRQGKARRIIKPGQIFSRIHVEDIARVLEISINCPRPGAIYNLCDDEPAPPQDVIAYAARLLEVPLPPEVDFDEADMTPMARAFYMENKRVSASRVKGEFGIDWLYPHYRAGLDALLKAEKG